MEIKSDETLSLACKLLARRTMSCQELNDALIKRGVSPEEAAKAVSRTLELGLTNDLEYADILVRRYWAQLHGKAYIRIKLRHHGISDEDISVALDGFEPDYDGLLRLLLSRLDSKTDYKTMQRGNALLYRRGFSPDEIRHALHLYAEYVNEADALDGFDGE